jgi:lipopolysaccharide/colanic/teichoic acid biosynthesis glycosyltransferase
LLHDFDRIKRVLDVILSAVLIAALAPVAAAVALAVRISLGSPVLFRQQRAGLHGQPFTIFKFRSLPLSGAMSASKPMRALRAFGLDELPQLWNVLIGDMSLVGPRPLFVHYLERYSALQRRRLEVRPGITGWAQVNGRNGLDWESQFALDVWYVDHRSFVLDARIIARTIVVLLTYGLGSREAERDEFKGAGSVPRHEPIQENQKTQDG